MLQRDGGYPDRTVVVNCFAFSRIERMENDLKRRTTGKIPEVRCEKCFQIGVSVDVQIGSTVEQPECGDEPHQSEYMIAMQV